MKIFACAILCCTVLAVSCSAPNEIDTPRKTTYGNDPVKFTISAVEISVTSDPLAPPVPYSVVLQQADLDTSGGIYLWLKGTCTRPASADQTTLPLSQIIISFDRLNIGAGDVRIMGDTGPASGTSLVCYSFRQDGNVILVPDDGFTNVTIQNVQHDTRNRTVTGDLIISISPDGREVRLDGRCTLRY